MALIEDLDDRTLVEQHRAGDDDAFRRIVERHHRSLYANALRRLGDPVLAEDAVQETFLRAFRNLGHFEGDYRLDAWLHRIVTNACHDIGRRQGRDSRLFDRACTVVEVEAPPADDGIEILEPREIDRVLDQLPATYREALLLRFVDELSYSDVALKTGVSEENARARVSRGRTMLKRMMTSTSALIVWAIPPLRRAQVQAPDPDAASQAAHQVHNLAGITNAMSTVAPSGGLGQLSAFVAQTGPAIATATPTVVNAGPAMKAAVAAGLAAAVAIPTGVAVDRVRDKPAPQAAAPLAEDAKPAAPGDPVEAPAKSASSSTKPSAGAETPVSALSSGGAVTGDVISPSTTEVAGSSTTTTATTPTTVAPVTPAPSDSGSTPPPSSTPPPPAEEPAPAPAPTGALSAGSLTVTEAGPRLEVAGPISLVVGDTTRSGQLSGKLLVGDADPKDPSAPRAIEGTLLLTFADGTTADLRFRGTTVVTDKGTNRSHAITALFRLEGAEALGLADSGELTGTLEVRSGSGSLTLALPGRTS